MTDKLIELRRAYVAGEPPRRAASNMRMAPYIVRGIYRQWLVEDGDRAPRCACSKPMLHPGKCAAETIAPIYDGPAWIGKPLSDKQIQRLRCIELSRRD